MMWRMKRAAAAGAVLLVLLSLTGCFRWWHEHDVSEGPLRERIGELESVVEVASWVDHMFGQTTSFVTVTVSDLIESDLQTIVANVDELLAGRDVTFDIRFDDVGVLSIGYPHDFSAEELANEVRYWLALSEANGAPLGMNLHNSFHGPYRNIWDPDKTDVVDWDALRAVPDPSTANRTYYLDGIVSEGSMPTPDVLALRDRLSAIELGDEESLELEYFAPGYIEVRFRAPGAGRTDPTALPSWAQVGEAVSQVAALRLPQSNFVLQGTGNWAPTASLYLGECVVIADESQDEASAELVTALSASGIEFPLGVGSGFCNDAVGLTADGHMVDS